MRWFLVDRIVECERGKKITGIKCFSRSDLLFMDHFHGFPIVPGVLQIEMMATTGGKMIKLDHPDLLPVVGSVKNAKFFKNIRPGDQCFIYMELEKLRKSYALISGRVEVGGEKMSECTIMFGLLSSDVIDPEYVDPVLEEYRLENGLPGLKKEKLRKKYEGTLV